MRMERTDRKAEREIFKFQPYTRPLSNWFLHKNRKFNKTSCSFHSMIDFYFNAVKYQIYHKILFPFVENKIKVCIIQIKALCQTQHTHKKVHNHYSLFHEFLLYKIGTHSFFDKITK